MYLKNTNSFLGKSDVVHWWRAPEQGADPNMVGFNRFTPLSAAVRKGHTDVVRRLISFGADVNLCVNYKATALMEAVLSKNVEMVHCLLTYPQQVGQPPADIKCVYNDRTPLLQAVQENCIEIARLFLQHGANHRIKNINGYGLMHIAVEKDFVGMLKLLLAAMAMSSDAAGNTPLDGVRTHNAVAAVSFLQGLSVPLRASIDATVVADGQAEVFSRHFTSVPICKQWLTCVAQSAQPTQDERSQVPDGLLTTPAGLFSQPQHHPPQQVLSSATSDIDLANGNN